MAQLTTDKAAAQPKLEPKASSLMLKLEARKSKRVPSR